MSSPFTQLTSTLSPGSRVVAADARYDRKSPDRGTDGPPESSSPSDPGGLDSTSTGRSFPGT